MPSTAMGVLGFPASARPLVGVDTKTPAGHRDRAEVSVEGIGSANPASSVMVKERLTEAAPFFGGTLT